MKIIKIREQELNVPEGWIEISFEKYITIMDLYGKIDDMIEEEFLTKFFSILLDITEDYINDLYQEELMELIGCIEPFQQKIEFIRKDIFEIDGKLYGWKQCDQLTMGENISIKLMLKRSKSQYESDLNIATILLRPVTVVKNDVGETYEYEKFNSDKDLLDARKELFMKLPAPNIFFISNFFLTGS